MKKFILKRSYLGKDGLTKYESWPERFNTYADALNEVMKLDRSFAQRRDPDHMGFTVYWGGRPAEGRFEVTYNREDRMFSNA
mgnify:CR=1 FL=1